MHVFLEIYLHSHKIYMFLKHKYFGSLGNRVEEALQTQLYQKMQIHYFRKACRLSRVTEAGRCG